MLHQQSFIGLAIDATAVLRPSVYILRQSGRVVWVGAAKSPAARIHAHLCQTKGAKIRPGLPARPVIFDTVELRPCFVDDLAATLASTRAELGFAE